PTIDGSTWYPFSGHLLFTSESGSNASIMQATLDVPSKVEDISGIVGRAAYEGVQADHWGRLILVEDSSGATGTAFPHARQPNSFVYRFLPNSPSDLKAGGKLQVLQVKSKAHAGAIVFHAGSADADISSQDQKDLHTYGNVFQTTWVTIHDTAVNGFAPYSANALAKTAGGTPFKRPENGQFRPGTNFSEFIFVATGDTNALTEAAAFGGFGAIFRLHLSGDSGTLALVFRGDLTHTGMDNCGFWDQNRIVFVEDAGDGLHGQRNALDSAYLFDLNTDYSNPTNKPVRVLAEGRDASATLDSQFSGMTGFQNDGDNEITGWHESDGDPGSSGLLGAKIPTPFRGGWRVFFTQQHGDNNTFEILRKDKAGDDDDRD
ncbi:MAG TPA: alkaline phosphatase PhoX, partial [Candidatus Acidoferrum sp.]|nr:alkaline phosphatase PhoX [Candidatus Acidoferrum sp.]